MSLHKKITIKKKLKKTFGFGEQNSTKALKKAGINPRTNPSILMHKTLNKVKSELKFFYINKELNDKIYKYIHFYIQFKMYRGIRHKKRLPVRGQRTHTNAKTIKKIKLLKL